jgi:acyl-CoA dehydrogenase
VARIFSDMRAFRIYDGPSEVHRWSIAKRILKGARRDLNALAPIKPPSHSS